MRDRLRPLLAAFLAVVLPGLGHLVLRQWGRALVWHGTIVGGTLALFVLYDVEPADPLADPAAFTASVPVEVSIPVTFLVGLSALDAYLVGRTAATSSSAVTPGGRAETAGEPGATRTTDGVDADAAEGVPQVKCPSCGRETDAEIDFCHWCTEPLPMPDGAN